MLNQVLAVRQDSLLEFGAVEVDKPKVILVEDALLDLPNGRSELQELCPHKAIINLDRLVCHIVALVALIIQCLVVIAACSE